MNTRLRHIENFTKLFSFLLISLIMMLTFSAFSKAEGIKVESPNSKFEKAFEKQTQQRARLTLETRDTKNIELHIKEFAELFAEQFSILATTHIEDPVEFEKILAKIYSYTTTQSRIKIPHYEVVGGVAFPVYFFSVLNLLALGSEIHRNGEIPIISIFALPFLYIQTHLNEKLYFEKTMTEISQDLNQHPFLWMLNSYFFPGEFIGKKLGHLYEKRFMNLFWKELKKNILTLNDEKKFLSTTQKENLTAVEKATDIETMVTALIHNFFSKEQQHTPQFHIFDCQRALTSIR